MDTQHADADLIKGLGGPAQLVKLLGWEKPGSIQRVQNWTTRGIPARVRLEHPDVFSKQERAA